MDDDKNNYEKLAEGSERYSKKGFAKSINISKGSLAELNTQLIIAKTFAKLKKDMNSIARMLSALKTSLTASTKNQEQTAKN